jgi:formylmethanofuran dehydrogenase subunit B
MDDSFLSGLNLFNEGYEMSDSNYVVTNEPTKVSVTLGYTLNLGNFQSLRLDLGVVDSRKSEENVNQAFERVYKFVEDKLTEKINEAKSEINE